MQRIGRHEVLEELDASGLLSTYDARTDEGRPVRLRVFTAGLEPHADAAERFYADAAAATRLSHPSLPKVVAWSAEDPIHLSTEPVHGLSLEAMWEGVEGPPLDPAQVVGLGAELSAALQTAHDAGLVHGGLSPRAVVVDAEGHAHVRDFALARFIASLSGMYSQLMPDTIDSFAPEQLTSPKDAAPATDVFALGTILYRAATGAWPIEAPTPLAKSLRLKMGKLEPIGSRGVALPEALSDIVTRMLGQAPSARPGMDEVQRALGALLDRTDAWRAALGQSVRERLPKDPAATPPAAPQATAPTAPAPPAPAAPAPAPAAPAPAAFGGPAQPAPAASAASPGAFGGPAQPAAATPAASPGAFGGPAPPAPATPGAFAAPAASSPGAPSAPAWSDGNATFDDDEPTRLDGGLDAAMDDAPPRATAPADPAPPSGAPATPSAGAHGWDAPADHGGGALPPTAVMMDPRRDPAPVGGQPAQPQPAAPSGAYVGGPAPGAPSAPAPHSGGAWGGPPAAAPTPRPAPPAPGAAPGPMTRGSTRSGVPGWLLWAGIGFAALVGLGLAVIVGIVLAS